MSDELFIFSYDDDEDALNTLARYYQTTKEHIRSKWRKLKIVYREYQESHHQTYFLMGIIACLGSDPLDISNPVFKIFFYHRTGSDGTKEWFSKGLLNSKDGIVNFVANIHSQYPDLGISDYESQMLAKDSQKHGPLYYSTGTTSLGPFGFYRKEDACALTEQRSFLNLSEIFYDVAHNSPIYSDLIEKLHPTVVKFWVEKPTKYIDHYLLTYWMCLLDKSIEPGDDVGRGQNIPFENIEEVIKLPKYIDTDSLVHEI
ncbi:hypothetical protein [Acinetobacter sp. WC-141]|uniref:hypothetical protein n=1 Tax=Acinetobacter sp. WC-141 TaxID=903915 RepID=UPI00029C9A2F|nr:hypothetical protein [Acinetobacter sp. WC-141]EKU38753.1 hypothetical protein ACINWC141_1150 [Acinetobacter sp. WC-141]